MYYRMKFIEKEDGSEDTEPKPEDNTESSSEEFNNPEEGYGADIETGADTLLGFLEEKTKFPVKDIAEDLGVPEKTVKVWGKALEQGGYIKISYSAIKGMVLEYDAGSPYEELNVDRSELPTDMDEIKIDVDETDIVEEEKTELTETGHKEERQEETEDTEDTEDIEDIEKTEDTEDIEKTEDTEDIEKTESESTKHTQTEEKNNKPDENVEVMGQSPRKDSSQEEAASNNEERDEVEETGEPSSSKESQTKDLDSETNPPEESGQQGVKGDVNQGKEGTEENELSSEEGKRKLKQELKKLSNSGKSHEKEKSANVHAEKAKIKKKSTQVRKRVQNSGSSGKGTAEEHKDKPRSKSGSDTGKIHASKDLGGHGEKILEIGRKFVDPQRKNEDLYPQLNREISELEEYLIKEDIDEHQRREIAEIMDKTESYIENEQQPEDRKSIKKFYSKIQSIKSRFLRFLTSKSDQSA